MNFLREFYFNLIKYRDNINFDYLVFKELIILINFRVFSFVIWFFFFFEVE